MMKQDNYEIKLDGVFTATVLSNQDPERNERLLVSVNGVHDEKTGVWATHCSNNYSISGGLPSINSIVYVMFLKDFTGNYNPNDIIWIGFKV